MRSPLIGQNGHGFGAGMGSPERARIATSGWHFRCPVCHAALELENDDQLVCTGNRHTFRRLDGIWRCLPEDRYAGFEKFIQEYEIVRRFEGRSSDSAAYYEALPFQDLTGRFTADWHIRAKSFRALVKRVIKPFEALHDRPLKILDLGAGNGWLSNRIAQRGHIVAAIDLLTNEADGLGTHRHYHSSFMPVQAEFDHLPLASHQADLAIFNGSIHYSANFNATLEEALRVLRPDGLVVILDSPVYRAGASGTTMVQEREARFVKQLGFRSNSIPMENFLTFDRLDQLAGQVGIRWSIHEPFYGWRWALKPWIARVRRGREPAKFLLIAGCRDSARRDYKRTLKRRVAWLMLRLTRPWKARKQQRVVIEEVAGHPIVVMPQVFNPHLMRSGELFAAQLNERTVRRGGTVLDLGTGSGIGAIVAATWAREVVAVDINPVAVRCATINAMLNQVDERVSVRHGDLFSSVAEQRFDLILFNPPFYRGTPRDLSDKAWRSEDAVVRFAAEVSQHLTEDGEALVILSTDGEEAKFLAEFSAAGLQIERVMHRDFTNEIFTIYRLTAGPRIQYDHSV